MRSEVNVGCGELFITLVEVTLFVSSDCFGWFPCKFVVFLSVLFQCEILFCLGFYGSFVVIKESFGCGFFFVSVLLLCDGHILVFCFVVLCVCQD